MPSGSEPMNVAGNPNTPVRKPSGDKISPLGVIAPPPIHVESPRFTGSLATLFLCVRDRKVDLLDVPLLPICEAYLIYLTQSAAADVDEAGAALAALAYLLERKAWALLPTEEPEPQNEDPIELPSSVAGDYEAAIAALQEFQLERESRFFRPMEGGTQAYEMPFDLGDITPADLARSFERVLRKAVADPPQMLGRPRRPLSEEMRLVLGRVTDSWQGFEALLPDSFTRTDAVYGFLAVLELVRLGQVAITLAGSEVQFSRARRGAKK